MAVRVLEIKPATAMPMIDLHIGPGTGTAAVGDILVFDSGEDRIEFRVGNLEGVMVRFELAALVEIERQRVVDLHRCEVRDRTGIFEPKDARKELRGPYLVLSRHDRVVENDSHRSLPQL